MSETPTAAAVTFDQETSPTIDALRSRTAELPLESPGPDALAGRTLLMSGGSRGIGLEIALAAAKLGANIAFLAKTAQPDPRLTGTVYTAVEQVREVGGQAVPIVGDIRSDDSIAEAIATTVDTFGGIDIVVNNASAINVVPTTDLAPKRFDLMLDINVRGTHALTQAALPYLRQSEHAHILTLSPPINLDPKWLGAHPAYTMTKYAMSMLTLGFADEFPNISANCLWPETMIATDAVANNKQLGSEAAVRHSREPKIMADAAAVVLASKPGVVSGHTLVDADIVKAVGQHDLTQYGGQSPYRLDLFL